MESQYQRSKIQEESLYYEELKQSGEYPLIGINTFLREQATPLTDKMLITRMNEADKIKRIAELRDFQARHADQAAIALERLKETTIAEGNIFEELLNTVQYASLGQITQVLFEAGGKYRRGF